MIAALPPDLSHLVARLSFLFPGHFRSSADLWHPDMIGLTLGLLPGQTQLLILLVLVGMLGMLVWKKTRQCRGGRCKEVGQGA